MKTTSVFWPALAAAIATLGVAIHLAAIAGGPSWYAWFGAPPVIVASARAGTWLAPASAAGIAALMGVCAAYACSAIGYLPRLPWRRPVLAAIAAICLLRALLLVPLAIRFPALLTSFEIGAAMAWGSAGIGFAAAFLHVGKRTRLHREQGRA
jgi:hypothetical protein